MKEYFNIKKNSFGYYVEYENGKKVCNTDERIANIIGLSLYEYHTLLYQYKAFSKLAICSDNRLDFYFNNIYNCKTFCDYLNEVYSLMIKLVGD